MDQITFTALDGLARPVAGEAVEALRQRTRGPVLQPGSEAYEDATRIWNGVHRKRPGLVVVCSGVADVIDAVNFAREHGLLVSIRGGGHNVAGTALCDGGVTIDLSRLRTVRVNPVARTADVDPGATLGDLDRETQAFGLVAPAGVVSTTGVAGLTLGGGIGWVRRKHGMTIDNLLSVDVVTADGRFLTANERDHADLFWAIRGGGGNFGVVTSFRFRLHPLGPQVALAAPMYPVEQAGDILPKWREFCDRAPDEVSSFCMFQTIPAAEAFPQAAWNSNVVALATLYAGPVEDGMRALQPLREMGSPVLDMSGPIDFRALQQAFDWVAPSGGRYYWKTTTLPALDSEAIATIVDIGRSRSSPGTLVAIMQMGGAIARIADDATGYGPRSDAWTVNIDSCWTDPAEDDRHIEFTRDAWQRLQGFSSGGMYLHYGSLEPQDRIKAAYGPSYDRLARIKTRYDPMNLFRVNQNIRPSEPE